MHRLMVFGLLAVLFLGTCMSLSANTLEEDFAKTLSSSTPSNIIDHLPFVINTTDAYYITRDLKVNGTGMTILADNVVLIGQGYTITGNGTGNGISTSANGAAIIDCDIRNFHTGIYAGISGESSGDLICNNKIHSNWRAVYLANGGGDRVIGNLIINNSYGLVTETAVPHQIDNNCFWNDQNAVDYSATGYLNTSKTQETNIIHGPYKGGNYWHDYAGIDTDGDGIGDTNLPYTSNGYTTPNGDYLPLVDTMSPQYDLRAFNSSSPSVSLSITWMDNVQLDMVILELDGANYTNSAKVNESFGFNEHYQVEHKATYASFFILPTGPHAYRWYANDTSNQWNSTQLQSYNVIQTNINSVDISSTLKVSANITCQGASNITEVIDTVDLEFNIDGTWYSRDMTYSPSTRLYSALIPEYNQLANKTILVYVAAKTKQNQFLNSDVCIYHVPQWVAADLNRDGKVTILDIVKATSQYGKP